MQTKNNFGFILADKFCFFFVNSFLILSFLITLIANLNIFISATSISCTCFFVTATVSSLYTIAGLTTELYTFSFTPAGNPLSQITHNTVLHPFHSPSNIEGLNASKMNVLHHLAMQSETLVILLQETYCTDAEKLVLPNYQLAGSSLSRKDGLATFVHERLRYTLLDQSPPTSEIEWLCVDVDGCKIVNVYKPTPTRLRTLDLPVFPHPCLYAGDFNCRHADWGYDDNRPDGECLAGWASINCFALLYNGKDDASFYSGRWNTGTNPDLAFASLGPNSCLPDRCVFDKFPRSQHQPSLITPPRLAMAVPSMPVK